MTIVPLVGNKSQSVVLVMGSYHEILILYAPPLIWWPRSSCDCWDWYKSSLNLRCGLDVGSSRKNKKEIKRKGTRTKVRSQFTYYVVNLVLMALARPEHLKEWRTPLRINSDFSFFFSWFQDIKSLFSVTLKPMSFCSSFVSFACF
jgi:hypothetical protein